MIPVEASCSCSLQGEYGEPEQVARCISSLRLADNDRHFFIIPMVCSGAVLVSFPWSLLCASVEVINLSRDLKSCGIRWAPSSLLWPPVMLSEALCALSVSAMWLKVRSRSRIAAWKINVFSAPYPDDMLNESMQDSLQDRIVSHRERRVDRCRDTRSSVFRPCEV